MKKQVNAVIYITTQLANKNLTNTFFACQTLTLTELKHHMTCTQTLYSRPHNTCTTQFIKKKFCYMQGQRATTRHGVQKD